MHYFLFTNAPDCFPDCRAIWKDRKKAQKGITDIQFLDYFRLFRGHWTGGVIPAMRNLKEVKINTLLVEAEKQAK